VMPERLRAYKSVARRPPHHATAPAETEGSGSLDDDDK
jgi:hypothetical protein